MDVPVYFPPDPVVDVDEEAVLAAVMPRFCRRCFSFHAPVLECPIRVSSGVSFVPGPVMITVSGTEERARAWFDAAMDELRVHYGSGRIRTR